MLLFCIDDNKPYIVEGTEKYECVLTPYEVIRGKKAGAVDNPILYTKDGIMKACKNHSSIEMVEIKEAKTKRKK